MRNITKIILHYSATDYEHQRAEWIDKIHRKRGFTGGIGYHYFIRHSGCIEHGRAIEIEGAHTRGHNSSSIGICLAGREKFTKEQVASLKVLLDLLKRLFPRATLHAHRDFAKTQCPGPFELSPMYRYWNRRRPTPLTGRGAKE